MILPRRHIRPAIALACAAVGLVVVGFQQIEPPVRPRMVAGSTWLASRSIGELTLVDGVSAAVSTNVPVHQPNVPFTVVIGKNRAYAVDPDSGTVVGVSGSTLEKAPLKPLSAVKGLSVQPVDQGYFAIDREAGLLQAVGDDGLNKLGAQTRLRDKALSVAADSRRVWLADGRSGALQSFEVGATDPIQRELRDVHQTDSTSVEILIAGDQPIVVDRTHDSATLITRSGEIDIRTPLSLEDGDLVAATANAGRVLLLQPTRGAVMSCDVRTGTCGASYSVPQSDFGTPVEAGGRAFVPDRATNRVHVVNLVDGSTTTTEPLVDAGVAFELSTRDGVVFFNDPASEKAGVIDGRGVVRRINKYDPSKPPSASRAASSPPTETTSSPSATTSGPRPSIIASQGSRPDGTTGSLPVPTGSSSVVPDMPHINVINASPNNPEAGEDVLLTAEVSGAPPERWEWEVRRAGTVVTTSTAPQFKHRFAEPATYEVKLVIGAGTRRDELAKSIVVAAGVPSAKCGGTITQNVRLRSDLTCDGPGLIVGANDVVVDLGQHTITGSGTSNGVIATGRINVVVRGGTIRAFGIGINFDKTPSSTIDSVVFDANKASDVAINESADLTIQNSHLTHDLRANVSAQARLVGSSFTGVLLELLGSPRMTIADCTLTDSHVSYISDSNEPTIVDSELVRSDIYMSESDKLNATRNKFTSSRVAIRNVSVDAVIRDNEFIGAGAGVAAHGPVLTLLTVELNRFLDNDIGLDIWVRLPEVKNIAITGNTFVNNGVSGFLLVGVDAPSSGQLKVVGNTFTSNGHRPNGTVDDAGSSVNDGLHITAPPKSNIEIRDNTTSDNAEYGIEAADGTVVDGGGNRSTGDGNGCLGVTCG